MLLAKGFSGDRADQLPRNPHLTARSLPPPSFPSLVSFRLLGITLGERGGMQSIRLIAGEKEREREKERGKKYVWDIHKYILKCQGHSRLITRANDEGSYF